VASVIVQTINPPLDIEYMSVDCKFSWDHGDCLPCILYQQSSVAYTELQLYNRRYKHAAWRYHRFKPQVIPDIAVEEYIPSGRPLAQVARIKALAITTFASCILVIPVPVLWSSLV